MNAGARPLPGARAMLIFDADCGLCTRFAHSAFVLGAHVERVGANTLAPDAPAAAVLRLGGVDEQLLTTAMVLVDGPAVFVGARAFNGILRRRGGLSNACARVLELAPLRALETLIYREIASRRGVISRMIGASVCAVGPAAGGPQNRRRGSA